MKIETNTKKLTDAEYWKQYEKDADDCGMNHDLNIDVNVKFKGINGTIYETKENGINCNTSELTTFFENLKKTIRMLDESVSDRITGEDEDDGL